VDLKPVGWRGKRGTERGRRGEERERERERERETAERERKSERREKECATTIKCTPYVTIFSGILDIPRRVKCTSAWRIKDDLPRSGSHMVPAYFSMIHAGFPGKVGHMPLGTMISLIVVSSFGASSVCFSLSLSRITSKSLQMRRLCRPSRIRDYVLITRIVLHTSRHHHFIILSLSYPYRTRIVLRVNYAFLARAIAREERAGSRVLAGS